MEKLSNIHPGEVLKEDFLAPFNISAYILSKDIGLCRPAKHTAGQLG